MLLISLNEYNLSYNINGFKFNLSDKRLGHGRRIKIIPDSGSRYGTEVPVRNEILDFNELRDDRDIHLDRSNGTDKLLDLCVGFIVMHHKKLLNYFDAVDRDDPNLQYFKNIVNDAESDYCKQYKINDRTRIRNDANEHVRLIRAGVIPDT